MSSMTPEQAANLVAMVTDFSRGDVAVIEKVKAAIQTPPRTTETVGYYLSGKENDFENCFRYSVSLLEPYTTSAEDKYCYEIFSEWIGDDRLLKHAPPELVQAFPDLLGADEATDEEPPDSGRAAALAVERIKLGYVAGARALEHAFEEAGLPLLSIDTGGGDTLTFINVERPVADRWRGKILGKTHEGAELAVRAPMWKTFWFHLAYAFMAELGEPPEELAGPGHQV